MSKEREEKIMFIGGRDRGLECITALINSGEKLAYIYCLKEDDHEIEKFSPEIESLAKHNKIPITVTKSVKSPEKIEQIREINPDLIVVMGWRTIIPNEVLEVPRFGTVAAHEALLPKYRGFAPINWAIINGERKTGVTLFYLDDGMDSGDIVGQKRILIDQNETAQQIYLKTTKASIELLMENLDALKKGSAPRTKQDNSKATYTCARTPEDGEISWKEASLRIHNLIRALANPYPGAYTTYNGSRLTVQKTEIVEKPWKYIGTIPGRIVSIGDGWVIAQTGDGVIKIHDIETEPGKLIKASDYLNSVKGTLGR